VLATAFFANSARIAYPDGGLFRAIKAAFIKAYVKDDGRIKGDTQTCYVLALRFDLLPENLRSKALQHLVDDIEKRGWHASTGFVGVGHLLPALADGGRLDVAYRLLMNDTFPSWGFSIKHGATTIWERWDGWTPEKGFQDPGMNSFNHYSFGSVGEWLYRTVAGIAPATPGYEHILFAPRPGGGLTWAKAEYESIRGRISSSWTLKDGQFTLEIVVPPNTTATVSLPGSEKGLEVEAGRHSFKSRVK